MALTDIPATASDGEYVLNVETVERALNGHEAVETVFGELAPVGHRDDDGQSVVLSGDLFPGHSPHRPRR